MSLERQMERLEHELAATDDPAERKAIQAEMRELRREAAEQERWEREGDERGWR